MKQIVKIFIFFICLLNVASTSANNNPNEKTIMISGKIIDLNHNESLAGVSITTSLAEKTIYSDLNGNFYIYLKVKDTSNFKIEFSQIGYASKTLSYKEISSNSNNIEITLTEE